MTATKPQKANGVKRRGGEWAARVVAIAETQDRDAFKLLFDHFAPRVKSFMLRSGLSESAADEIAQETLLTVWRKAAQYKPDKAAVSTWIFTIARNNKIDKFRKDSRPLPDVNDPSFSGEGEKTPEQVTWSNMSADNVHQALGALPKEQRDVLYLAFIEENPHRKVADELGIPLGTVKSRIRLGLDRLRTILNDHRGDFS